MKSPAKYSWIGPRNNTKLRMIKMMVAARPQIEPVAEVMILLALNLSRDPRRVELTNISNLINQYIL